MKNTIDFLKMIRTVLQIIWNEKLPKVIKVAVYMAVASFFYQFSKDIQISKIFNFIPEAYRIILINFVVVILVEVYNYFKNLEK
jgi:Na+-transporting NADH:ubiquinone oxidoreductase subunit NqrD